MRLPSFHPWRLTLLVLLGHLLLSSLWLSFDASLPDGDAVGHLGAMEDLEQRLTLTGLVPSLRDAFTAETDYPPLFPLAHAALRHLLHLPGPFPRGVGALQLFWSSLCLLSVAGLTAQLTQPDPPSRLFSPQRPSGPDPSPPRGPSPLSPPPATPPGAHRRQKTARAMALAALAWITFPLPAALAREAMPEPFLALWVTTSLWAALASRDFTRTLPSLLLGFSLLAAGLTKQTALLYLAAPLALLAGRALSRDPRQAGPRLMLVLVTALPIPLWWLSTHWASQQDYGLYSATARGSASWLDHLLYYPTLLAGSGVGILWLFPFCLAFSLLWQRRQRLLLVAFLLSWLLLTAVPKKYPRLLVPLLPLAAALLGAGLQEARGRNARRLLLLGLPGLALGHEISLSFAVPWVPDGLLLFDPPSQARIDPSCPQVWIRRAARHNLGFETIHQALLTAHPPRSPMPIVLVDVPEIPCAYETTFGYVLHLQEYLRRRQLEPTSLPLASEDPAPFEAALPRASLVVSTQPWCEGASSGPGCWARGDFTSLAPFVSTIPNLPFTLHLYTRRVSPSHAPSRP